MDAEKRGLMETYNIIYSDACKSQITYQLVFLKQKIGGIASAKRIKNVLKSFEERIEYFPESSPFCSELISLGITKYRDYIDPKNNLRILYTVDEQNQTINAEAFLNTRQSITEALVSFCLVHD